MLSHGRADVAGQPPLGLLWALPLQAWVLISYPISAVRYWGNGLWIACCLPSGAANRLLPCPACLAWVVVLVSPPAHPPPPLPNANNHQGDVLLVSTSTYISQARAAPTITDRPSHARWAMPCNMSLLAPSARLTGCGTDAARDQPRVECKVVLAAPAPRGSSAQGGERTILVIFWNSSGRGRRRENEDGAAGRAYCTSIHVPVLELNRATGCEARTGREPRRADVTTWQMLLFWYGLQW